MYIYKLTNLINKKAYVGLTTRKLDKRIKEHISDKQSVISRAIKKYGFDNFLVEVIEELTDLEVLKEREIYYIHHFNTLNPDGYNIIDSHQNLCMSRKNIKTFELKDPEGNIHIIDNIMQFCKENNFVNGRFYLMGQGLANIHKGWSVLSVDFKPIVKTCRATSTAPWDDENYRKMMTDILIKANYEHMDLHREIGERVWGSKRLKYEMTTPEGISFCIEGLNRFCKENELDTSNMAKVAQGKAKHYKKWKCKVIE